MQNHLSIKNNNILLAIEKGYYVDKEGNVFSKYQKLKPSIYLRKNKNPKHKQYFTSVIKIRISKPYRTTRNVLINKLQAYQKFGNRIFEKGIQVRHLNGNPLDNSWDNISIGSQSENTMDIPKSERIIKSLKAVEKTRKLSSEALVLFRQDRERGLSLRELSEKYSISKSTASYIVSGKTYKNR